MHGFNIGALTKCKYFGERHEKIRLRKLETLQDIMITFKMIRKLRNVFRFTTLYRIVNKLEMSRWGDIIK